MKKEEIIKQYGIEEYQRQLEDNKERTATWSRNNIKKVEEAKRERMNKGGKYYQNILKYNRSGIQKSRRKIRNRDARRWKKYKGNWLTETEIHHCWIPGTAQYNGIALVDKMEHQHRIINPIEILEGIIILMEAEI